MATSKKAHIEPSTFHDGKQELTSQEESVTRLRHGIGGEPDEILQKKTNNKELLSRLLDLERAIIEKARSRTVTKKD